MTSWIRMLQYDESSGFKPIPPDEYVEWFSDVASNVRAILAADGSWCVNIKPHSDGLDTSLYVMDLVLAHARQWGWHFASEFCWERNGVPGKPARRLKNQYEPVFQFATGEWKFRPQNVMHASDNVPTYSKDNQWSSGLADVAGSSGKGWANKPKEGKAYPGNRLPPFPIKESAGGHGAVFPIGLPTFFVNLFTDKDDHVYEPFSGSGTTIIACEQTGRVCHAIELSPAYVDVAVKRWQSFTGKAATLDGDGRTFDVITQGRA